jgi:hypothetical protein
VPRKKRNKKELKNGHFMDIFINNIVKNVEEKIE